MTTPASRDTPILWFAAQLDDLEDGVPHGVVLADGERVCLLRKADQVWAVQDICPHRGFGLSGGDCVEMANGAPVIECPWHGARFSCADGAVLRGPAADSIDTYDVRIRHGQVFIGERRTLEEARMSTTIISTSTPAATSTSLDSLAPRADFPLLAAQPSLHYLDSAATSQKPRVVLDAITEFYSTANANPHRGAYALSAAATDAYHDARVTIAQFLGAADTDTLVFTRGTTESMNLVANAWGRAHVQPDDEIVISALEHHANFVPWQQLALSTGAHLRIAELTTDQRIDLDHLASLLTPRTRIVAITHVSNAVGSITPVAEVVRMVREKSPAIIVLDGAQGAPHLPVQFDALGVDFYGFSGHKLLGPMGIGGVIGTRARWLECQPWQYGGDMIEWVNDRDSTWNVLPHKFEAGTPNAADAVGLAAAVRYLSALDMTQVRAHELALLEAAHEKLAGLEGLHVYGPAAAQRSGVISFTLADVHPHDLATILDQHGVCIRAGHHCAQPLMRRLGVGATARASFYVYSDGGDVDALVEALAEARKLFA